MTEVSLDDLFTPRKATPIIRCECGRLAKTNYPHLCECGQAHTYFSSGGTTRKLEDVDVGYLSNLARRFGEMATEYTLATGSEYARHQLKAFEVALDLIYKEIGTREKEIAQLGGIMGALKKSLQSV